MTVSILIRLLPATRTSGRLAGQAEIVATGEIATFRNADDLVAVLQRVSGAPDGNGGVESEPDEAPRPVRPDRGDDASPSDPPTPAPQVRDRGHDAGRDPCRVTGEARSPRCR